MVDKKTFVFGKGAAKAELPGSWHVSSEAPEVVEFSPDEYWAVHISVDNRIFETPAPITERDIPQFLDRNVLVPWDIIIQRDDGIYYAQFLNRVDGRAQFIFAFCRQIADREVRRVTLTYSRPEDAEIKKTIIESIAEFAEATTISADPRDPNDKVERLETRLVAPFYEVLCEVPWDWTYEWSEEMELPLYYRDEEGTGTLQIQVDSFTSEESTAAEVEKRYECAVATMARALGHNLDSAVPIDDGKEARLFMRIDPDYESSSGTEVSAKWTRFTLFSSGFSVVNFDFLVSKEQHALSRVQKELEFLHEGILRARVRPPKADRAS